VALGHDCVLCHGRVGIAFNLCVLDLMMPLRDLVGVRFLLMNWCNVCMVHVA
jgi:hypothetical protein